MRNAISIVLHQSKYISKYPFERVNECTFADNDKTSNPFCYGMFYARTCSCRIVDVYICNDVTTQNANTFNEFCSLRLENTFLYCFKLRRRRELLLIGYEVQYKIWKHTANSMSAILSGREKGLYWMKIYRMQRTMQIIILWLKLNFMLA